MLSRRQFLLLAGEAAAGLALPGCAASPPFRKEVFPELGDAARPYLGLATTLREEHDYEARVEGAVPAELRGTLYRNGPGLFDRGGLRKRALFDGDGMVQSFRFHDDGVRYRNRFVRTPKYAEEEAAGRFIYQSWSTQAPGGFPANFWGADNVRNQAGVTVFLRGGRLYAFDDTGLPFELDPVTLATIGRTSFGLPEDFTIYAAHSKMDPVTGEWLHFGVRYGPHPLLHITVFDRTGGLKLHRAFPLPRYVYMHDWIVADRHVIISLHPAEIHFWGFMLGFRSLLESIRWEPARGNLLMVVEREGNGAPLFLETPASFMWHSVNACEAGGEIRADFVGYATPDHFTGRDPVVTAVMAGRKGNYSFPGELRRYTIDPARRTVRQETLDGGNYEWPRVNELHRCHAYRIAYLAKTHPGEFFWSIITRIDMESGRTASYDFGPGVYCGEPVFVPFPGRRYRPDDPEEPGWLLSELYDSRTRKSCLAVLRADALADGPVATVWLRHHVPFSFHGWWSADERMPAKQVQGAGPHL
ncbi:MAG TPA: carotenoid oxygenase family protein [Geobacteraceae bacterium]